MKTLKVIGIISLIVYLFFKLFLVDYQYNFVFLIISLLIIARLPTNKPKENDYNKKSGFFKNLLVILIVSFLITYVLINYLINAK